MIYTESEKDSLSRFMRGFSPLNEFARSVRGEAALGEATSTENDPFAGINIDDLPDDLKEKLTKAKGSFATLQGDLTKEKGEKEKLDKLAKGHQSRADQYFELAKKHNLINQQGQPSVNGNADDPMIQKLADQLRLEMGLAPDAALAHAKIQIASFKTLKPELFNEIGTSLNPTFGAVGEMYASKLFMEAQLPKNDPEGILQIPEINKLVEENLAMLVKSGATINADTITNIKAMEYGRYTMGLTPEKRQQFMNPQKQQFSTGSSFGSNGNFATLQNQQQQNNGAPQAVNRETAEAAEKTKVLLMAGMKPKK